MLDMLAYNLNLLTPPQQPNIQWHILLIHWSYLGCIFGSNKTLVWQPWIIAFLYAFLLLIAKCTKYQRKVSLFLHLILVFGVISLMKLTQDTIIFFFPKLDTFFTFHLPCANQGHRTTYLCDQPRVSFSFIKFTAIPISGHFLSLVGQSPHIIASKVDS